MNTQRTQLPNQTISSPQTQKMLSLMERKDEEEKRKNLIEKLRKTRGLRFAAEIQKLEQDYLNEYRDSIRQSLNFLCEIIDKFTENYFKNYPKEKDEHFNGFFGGKILENLESKLIINLFINGFSFFEVNEMKIRPYDYSNRSLLEALDEGHVNEEILAILYINKKEMPFIDGKVVCFINDYRSQIFRRKKLKPPTENSVPKTAQRNSMSIETPQMDIGDKDNSGAPIEIPVQPESRHCLLSFTDSILYQKLDSETRSKFEMQSVIEIEKRVRQKIGSFVCFDPSPQVFKVANFYSTNQQKFKFQNKVWHNTKHPSHRNAKKHKSNRTEKMKNKENDKAKIIVLNPRKKSNFSLLSPTSFSLHNRKMVSEFFFTEYIRSMLCPKTGAPKSNLLDFLRNREKNDQRNSQYPQNNNNSNNQPKETALRTDSAFQTNAVFPSVAYSSPFIIEQNNRRKNVFTEEQINEMKKVVPSKTPPFSHKLPPFLGPTSACAVPSLSPKTMKSEVQESQISTTAFPSNQATSKVSIPLKKNPQSNEDNPRRTPFYHAKANGITNVEQHKYSNKSGENATISIERDMTGTYIITFEIAQNERLPSLTSQLESGGYSQTKIAVEQYQNILLKKGFRNVSNSYN
ncbi:hypothetical protein M0811_09817 [Anaeramoeba ignava]|uniref:Spt20-like SEP domain-containing protein n=1 Tax=Anaeramoeba ignava TaxID=1746090 RepID=A0A9Q0LI75_ANAIG|nr:hypothetical protein M0811_09817 [Anaeramoeba ignava]